MTVIAASIAAVIKRKVNRFANTYAAARHGTLLPVRDRVHCRVFPTDFQ